MKKIKTDSSISPLIFTIEKKYKRARKSVMRLPHGKVRLPVYMPVGTKGSIKGLTSEEVEQLDCWLLLGNTYHLNNSPTAKFLHEKDSGGFQMVSLSKFCQITEDAVTFEHPTTHEEMYLRPEDSIEAQNNIGSDIMMALDDVVEPTSDKPRIKEACERTIRWIDRCLKANRNPQTQNLFPIVQGGLDYKLRDLCLTELSKRDAYGFAIGGLAGGEAKIDFIKIVAYCTARLPENKPRYLMGLGYPEDLVICVSLGVDMFDCVFPTRTARYGSALTDEGNLRLDSAQFKFDFRTVDAECDCEMCLNYTRAYMHFIAGKEELAGILLTKHNIRYLLRLMNRMQDAIQNETLEEFVFEWMKVRYGGKANVPDWILEGFRLAEFNLENL